MAFTAIHPDAGRVDATLTDLGCGLTWAAVHRAKPRVALRCPECGYGVHAKLSSRHLRYFAHDPGRPADCAWLNESLEHHLLKLELATAIRAVGWHAELEVRAPDGRWRADVLASSQDGTRRIAWEAQLSPITVEDLHDRTARYQADGIGVCWVSPGGRAPWLGSAPSIRVSEPDDGRPWTVTDGIASFDYQQGSWVAVDGRPMAEFIGWVLHQRTISHEVLPRYRWISFPARDVRSPRSHVWTTSQHIQTETRHEAMRQRQDERKRQREAAQRQADDIRRAEAEAVRQETERQVAAYKESLRIQRELAAAAEQIRWENLQRQWAIDAEQARQRRVAEEHRQQEHDRLREHERLEQQQREQQMAGRWWAELSSTQTQELCDAVAVPLWKTNGARLEFGALPGELFAYGIPAHLRGRLYGVLRPSPDSIHRLPSDVTVYVRNAREANLLTATGRLDPVRVIHFGLPDHEQMTLI